jgi:hypothetical protein
MTRYWKGVSRIWDTPGIGENDVRRCFVEMESSQGHGECGEACVDGQKPDVLFCR